jgi:hypothetical protein
MHKKACNFGECVNWTNLVQNSIVGRLLGILELQNSLGGKSLDQAVNATFQRTSVRAGS